eukprot:479424_1
MASEEPWWRHIVYIEKGQYAIWNNARYKFKNELVNGSERWECTVVPCHACIYIKNGVFETYERHEYMTYAQMCEHPSSLHSHHHHSPWDKSAIVTYKAKKMMSQLVLLGRTASEAYEEYTLMNAVEMHHMNEPKQATIKSLNNIKSCTDPPNPCGIADIQRKMNDNKEDGWCDGYWDQTECELIKQLEDCDDEKFAVIGRDIRCNIHLTYFNSAREYSASSLSYPRRWNLDLTAVFFFFPFLLGMVVTQMM